MNAIQSGSGMLLLALVPLALTTRDFEPTLAAQEVVVGTFDSRALVYAHVRSESFRAYLTAQKSSIEAARERAEAEGDKALLRDLDALGPAMQRRTHEQGFGTAPVPQLLALIEDHLPAIAEEAGVDVIVSKWDLTYRASDARLVDVTDLIVSRLNPDERILQGVHELMSTEPASMEQLEHD